jgi:phosphomannomutase
MNEPIRFGTSGFRGRWGLEFVESRVKWVIQAICDDLRDQGRAGKSIVLGYDSREHADIVAGWCRDVILANDYVVHMANRDTPTPVLSYYGIEVLGEENIAGIINCTASHNPIEWHGIKFSTFLGCPAPLDVTSRIEEYANRYQDENATINALDFVDSKTSAQFNEIDPLQSYCDWLLSSGQSDNRIKLDHDAIKNFFVDKLVIVDEMHGTGRGYLTKILDTLAIPYEVLHGERDPKLGGLPAANPEEPHIQTLKDRVRESGAIFGIGLDTDADRYGVVDQGGQYMIPNQILSMLTKYLGVDRGIKGRLAMSHVTTRLVETIGADISGNDDYRPTPHTIPPYMQNPEYIAVVGELSDLSSHNVFTVPVGLKNIVEVAQQDQNYQPKNQIPENWRDNLLLGGEEASGLTTKGHVPDKDGIWAAILIMDMMAYYQETLTEIWSVLAEQYWPSHTSRINLDVPDEVKINFINSFLHEFSGDAPGEGEFAGLKVIYLGGIRNKLVEFRFEDAAGSQNFYMQSRPSGTEPLVRLYIEAESQKHLDNMEASVQEMLRSVLAR